jgi:hypothetical protein
MPLFSLLPPQDACNVREPAIQSIAVRVDQSLNQRRIQCEVMIRPLRNSELRSGPQLRSKDPQPKHTDYTKGAKTTEYAHAPINAQIDE